MHKSAGATDTECLEVDTSSENTQAVFRIDYRAVSAPRGSRWSPAKKAGRYRDIVFIKKIQVYINEAECIAECEK